MFEIIKKFFKLLPVVWNKQMRIKIPGADVKNSARGSNELEFACFPFLGWICGFLIACAGYLLMLIFNRFGGALIFAILGWLFMVFHDDGRGDGLISSAISSFLPGDIIPYRIVLPVFLMISKFALLMLLFYRGEGFYFAMVTGAVFSMEVLLISSAGFSPPVINNSERAEKMFWITCLILLLISFLFNRLGVALCAVSFALLWKYYRNTGHNKGITVDFIRFAGSIAGWTALFAGVLTI